MALPPKSWGTGRHVMAAPILDQGERDLTYVVDLSVEDIQAIRDGRLTRSVRRRDVAGDETLREQE
jgi:hypothetical protein